MDAFFRTIPGLLESIDESDEVRNAFMFAAWKRIAGEQIVERTEPVAFENKRLTVAVSDKIWQRNLESLASQLLFKLNALLGRSLVTFIEFRIEPKAIKVRADRSPDASETKDLLDHLPPEIINSASSISDPTLRRNVMLAAANCLARGK